MSDTLTILDRTTSDGEIEWASTTIIYRLARAEDELHLTTLFSRMLRELEEVGHNIPPTEHNILLFTTLFMGAIERGEHGIALAFTSGECIGATFFLPDTSGLEMVGKLAVAHGAYVTPEWRGRGVAKRLQSLAHTHLANFGYTSLVSVVMKGNTAGLASATAAGAEVTGHYTNVNLQEAL